MNGRACVSKCTCQKVEPLEICRRRLVLYSVGLGVSALCFNSAVAESLPEKEEADVIR